MFVIMAFRKNGDHRCIAVNKDRKVLETICNELSRLSGRTDSAEGLWDRDGILGNFWIEELGDDPIKNGLDFVKYIT